MEENKVVEMPKKEKPELPPTVLTDADLAPYIGRLVMENVQLHKENAILREALKRKE